MIRRFSRKPSMSVPSTTGTLEEPINNRSTINIAGFGIQLAINLSPNLVLLRTVPLESFVLLTLVYPSESLITAVDS